MYYNLTTEQMEKRHDGTVLLSAMAHYPVNHQQVDWVEQIKQVFGDGSLNEASFAIVQIDGDKGKACDPAAAKHA